MTHFCRDCAKYANAPEEQAEVLMVGKVPKESAFYGTKKDSSERFYWYDSAELPELMPSSWLDFKGWLCMEHAILQIEDGGRLRIEKISPEVTERRAVHLQFILRTREERNK